MAPYNGGIQLLIKRNLQIQTRGIIFPAWSTWLKVKKNLKQPVSSYSIDRRKHKVNWWRKFMTNTQIKFISIIPTPLSLVLKFKLWIWNSMSSQQVIYTFQKLIMFVHVVIVSLSRNPENVLIQNCHAITAATLSVLQIEWGCKCITCNNVIYWKFDSKKDVFL